MFVREGRGGVGRRGWGLGADVVDWGATMWMLTGWIEALPLICVVASLYLCVIIDSDDDVVSDIRSVRCTGRIFANPILRDSETEMPVNC